MKDDIPPAPEKIPKKRSAIRNAPDVWLRTWLETGMPSDQRKVQQEIDRRKKERATQEVRVGILVGKEGMTPEQMLAFIERLRWAAPTVIHQTWLPPRVYRICRIQDVPIVVHMEARTWTAQASEVVKNSDLVIAAPKEQTEPVQKAVGSVWGMVKYAKHRSVPVIIIDPGGQVAQ